MTTADQRDDVLLNMHDENGYYSTKRMIYSILVVEDDPAVAKGLIFGLKEEGFHVDHAATGTQAIELTRENAPHIILLDVRLPDVNGFDLCRQLRADGHSMPIIMVTARDEEIDKILGLEIGADDYITKPYSFRELVSRVRAQLRRSFGAYQTPDDTFRFGDIRIDQVKVEVYKGKNKVALTPIEYRLLHCLAQNPGTTLSRGRLIEEAWGHDMFLEDERTVDVHIRHLREKIEDSPGNPDLIETVRGFGYRLSTIKKT